jgi:hypothetical protein
MEILFQHTGAIIMKFVKNNGMIRSGIFSKFKQSNRLEIEIIKMHPHLLIKK